MAKVILTNKRKDEKGNIIKEENQFTVDRISFMAMIDLMKQVGSVLDEVKQNENLKAMIEGMFDGTFEVDEKEADNVDEERKRRMEQLEKMKDERFMNGLTQSLGILMNEMPDRALKLISTASEIDEDVIKRAYADEIMDVFDAIIDENDIVKLVGRVKKSLTNTKAKWVAMNHAKMNQ